MLIFLAYFERVNMERKGNWENIQNLENLPMNSRERWTVYPLLFLALGLALRDKIVPPSRFGALSVTSSEVAARKIECGELSAGRVICRGPAECGTILVQGPQGLPVVGMGADQKSNNGVIETFTADGKPLIQLQSSDRGGIVALFSHSGRVFILGETGPPDDGTPQSRHKR